MQQYNQHCREVMLRSFYLKGQVRRFHPQTTKLEPVLQHNKLYHRKVLLSSFHLNGHWHSLGFHLQTQKLEASCATKYTALQGRTLSSFHLKGHTRRYVIHSPNVGKALCSIIISTTAKYCSKTFNGHNSGFYQQPQ